MGGFYQSLADNLTPPQQNVSADVLPQPSSAPAPITDPGPTSATPTDYSNPAQMANAMMPDLSHITNDPTTNLVGQAAQAAQQPQRGGILKQMLTGFAYGASQAGMKHVGLPTDFDIRNQQLQQAQVQSQIAQRNFEIQQSTPRPLPPAIAQILGYPAGTLVAPNEIPKLLQANQLGLSRMGVAQLNNGTRLSIADQNNDTKTAIAGQADATKNRIADQSNALQASKLQAMIGLARERNAIAGTDAVTNRDRLELQKSMGGSPAILSKGMSSYDDAILADKRLAVMKDAIEHPNAQNDVALLFNHIGMTLSAQKGARITNAEIERAIQTRSLPQNLQAQWDKLQSGEFLSPQQRQQMYDLGVTNRNIAWGDARRKAAFYGLNREPAQNPNLPPLPNAPQSPQNGSGATGGGGPSVGQVKTFPNGRIGKWDGKGWVAQ